MAARTRGADTTTRAVLDLLAVVDRPLPLADLAVLTGLTAERLDPILATLIAGRAVAKRQRAAAGRPGAVAELDRAAVIFTQCGAAWRRSRTIQALRRLGSGGRRAAAAALGPASLTRREREVARLAARGMSAKAIAQALFVGERTVESHLSTTYAKLEVESKLDLIRRAAEFGLS